MAHAHARSHGHDHAPARDTASGRVRLAVTLGLVLVYMVAEIVGGLLANSLALLADAGHMLSDAGALALALFAIWFARRPAGPQHTYGYYRIEILAALVNGAALIAIAILIFVEAVERLRAPEPVAASLMVTVATGGLAINLAGLWTLHGVRGENLNTRGAWLHVLADTLGSVQAIVAGALILAFGWTWLDPVASVLIALLVLYSSWSLIRQSVMVLMEGAPGDVDVDAVRDRLRRVPGVRAVHDLHVWTISSDLVALSAHVEAHRPPDDVLRALRRDLEAEFGIRHTTIEFDPAEPDDRTLQPCK
jgi:cobalt-zinc-cadmium efflux system protein